jgi:hypothetical protein
MHTTKLARKVILGIGIPAALATGAIAAAASSNGSSSNGSPSSDQATTTMTQTAPASTDVVTVREPGEDVRGNADEAEHQGGADTGQGQDDQGNSRSGGGDDSNSGPGGGNDD